jgi:hypothetical protein
MNSLRRICPRAALLRIHARLSNRLLLDMADSSLVAILGYVAISRPVTLRGRSTFGTNKLAGPKQATALVPARSILAPAKGVNVAITAMLLEILG